MKQFLGEKLSLTLHARNDIILPCKDGLKFLGCMIYPHKRHLQKRVWNRVLERSHRSNISSYSGLVRAHENKKAVNHFDWYILDI